MRRRIFAILNASIFLILFFNLKPMTPVTSSSSTTTVYLVPSCILYTPSNGSVGTLFNVTVKVDNVSDLACFEVKMYYDDSLINVTRWYEPTDDPEYVFHGENTMPVPSPPDYYYRHDDPCSGSANVGLSMFPAPSPGNGFTGSGTLMIFEFKIKSVPEYGTYSCDLSIDNEDTYLLNSVCEDIIGVTKVDGYYQYQSINGACKISDFLTFFANNSEVKMIYPSDTVDKPLDCDPAMVSDWTASAFIFTKISNCVEGLDVEENFVNQSNGKAQGEPGIGIITFGGYIVNPIVKYAESFETPTADRAPVRAHIEADTIYFQYQNGTNIPGASLLLAVVNHDKDIFVIEVFEDREGRYMMLCYGFGWKGTYAAGKYFDTEIYPNLESYPNSWIIVKWEDTNGNLFVNTESDGDTYTLIASGN